MALIARRQENTYWFWLNSGLGKLRLQISPGSLPRGNNRRLGGDGCMAQETRHRIMQKPINIFLSAEGAIRVMGPFPFLSVHTSIIYCEREKEQLNILKTNDADTTERSQIGWGAVRSYGSPRD